MKSIIVAIAFAATAVATTSSLDAQLFRRLCPQRQCCPQPQCCPQRNYGPAFRDPATCDEKCAEKWGPNGSAPCNYCYQLCKSKCPKFDVYGNSSLWECVHDGTTVTSTTICFVGPGGMIYCTTDPNVNIPCSSRPVMRCCQQQQCCPQPRCWPRVRLFGRRCCH